ncbi:MAG TPA: cysteine dioxygenase family protein [Pseudonocardiaceae bacterium]
MFAVPENTIAEPADLTAAHPVRIATDYARNRGRWARLLRYDPDERFSVLIEANDQFEIWLLSWLPGQHTDLHDHGGATGAFTVVSGTLTESTARQDGSGERSQQLVAGQSRAFGPNYIHQVRNLGVDPAVSIHVYRPFRVMTHYR